MLINNDMKVTVTIVILAMVIIILSPSSYCTAAAPVTDCRKYDKAFYREPGEYAVSRIELQQLGTHATVPSPSINVRIESSPQGTRQSLVKSPDFTSEGPWDTEIYIRDNLEKSANLKIVFRDHASGGVRIRWLNEKLLFLQVWWGRIAATELILDIDTARWLYMEDANYGTLILPCNEHIKDKKDKQLNHK